MMIAEQGEQGGKCASNKTPELTIIINAEQSFVFQERSLRVSGDPVYHDLS